MAKETAKEMAKPMANSAHNSVHSSVQNERRNGLPDRRIAAEDRRNAERVADDPAPRRDPEFLDRRASAAIQRSAAQ